MNEISKFPSAHATTEAAEGLPRLKWTLGEFDRLSEIGFFGGIDSGREMIICDAKFEPHTVPPGKVLLLIEVSDSTQKYDEKTKAKIYSILGVREHWVVDAKSLSTLVYRDPSPGRYRSQSKSPKSKTLTPTLVPKLAISMGSFAVE